MQRNDTFPTQNSGRYSDIFFNRIACFGKEYSIDRQEISALTTLSEADIYKIFVRHHLNSEQLIKLFFQSALLDAFLSQNFPRIFSEDPDPIEIILKDLITSIAESKDIRPSTTVQTITTLLVNMEQRLQSLLSKVEQGIGIRRKPLAFAQRGDFKVACKNFLIKTREHFQIAQYIFITLKDDTTPNNDFISTCLKHLYTEYARGKTWAMHFFEYRVLNYSQVNIGYDTSENACSVKMETLSDNEERYIQLTISSRLSIKDFLNIPVYTFHEYISHLCASTDIRSREGELEKSQVIKSYEYVPTELDEGWMVHVAQKFLVGKMDTLPGLDRQHFQYPMEGAVNYWITNMHYPYAGKDYVIAGEEGARIATAFLRFLRQDVCEGDERKAYELYYRISIDLIMHYPSADFKHIDFIIAINRLCRSDKNQSIQIVRNSLDEEGTYINIERLWQLMKDLPGPSLEVIFQL